MNKIKLFISIFIIPVLVVLSRSFVSHAEAMPSIAEPTFELVNGGLDSLNNAGLASYGVFPGYDTSSIQVVNDYLNYETFLNPEDYHIRPLTDVEKEDIEAGFVRHFYDEEGNEISIDNLYYVEASNSFYKANFYIDSRGRVLYSDPESTHRLLTLGLDNKGFAYVTGTNINDWNDLYYELCNRISEQNFTYSDTEESLSGNTYFVWSGETYHGKRVNAGYVLIQNQYQPRVIVPVPGDPTIYRWYTNDLTLIQFQSTLGDISSWLSVTEGNYYDNQNRHYNYLVSFPRGQFAGSVAPVPYESWLTGVTNNEWFGTQGYNPSEVKPIDGKGVFKRTSTPEVPYISSDEMYDYDELQELQPSSQPEVNPNYDPSIPIGPDNFPNEYPLPNYIIQPSVSPLPGVSDHINPAPAPSDNPIINVDPSSPIGSSVPILNNLQRRFPFSIPWDIYRIVNRLVFTPRAPSWNFDYSITVWGHSYTTHFEGDLSAFNSLAEVFRNLQLIAFILFIAFFSYKHFF